MFIIAGVNPCPLALSDSSEVCNRSDLIADIMNMSSCCVLVPRRGKIILEPGPQNKILVPFEGFFQNITGHFCIGVPPPPAGILLYPVSKA